MVDADEDDEDEVDELAPPPPADPVLVLLVPVEVLEVPVLDVDVCAPVDVVCAPVDVVCALVAELFPAELAAPPTPLVVASPPQLATPRIAVPIPNETPRMPRRIEAIDELSPPWPASARR